MTVLLVDDSATMRLAISKIILDKYSNATILEAKDGKEAFNLLGKSRVDFIITDRNMEGMSGDEFVEKIKGSKILSKKKIAVLSSESTQNKRNDVVYIDKKSSIITLRDKILEFIE